MPAKILMGVYLLSFAWPSAENPKRERAIELPADNAMAELKPGPGAEVVRANCVACHSTDYIVRQPRSDATHWETEVRKMVRVFGAPISEGDVETIVRYLSTVYGPVPSSPRASPRSSHAEAR
jgi:sulfite dehydrogenase (cytochrome) subunit B